MIWHDWIALEVAPALPLPVMTVVAPGIVVLLGRDKSPLSSAEISDGACRLPQCFAGRAD
jgi:hypothetical protein